MSTPYVITPESAMAKTTEITVALMNASGENAPFMLENPDKVASFYETIYKKIMELDANNQSRR